MIYYLCYIWNPVHLVQLVTVQGSTRLYVLVRASTYLTRYKAVRETSKWYIPVRTNIENSYGSTYWYLRYVLPCTCTVQGGTRWYKVVQITVYGGTWRYKAVRESFKSYRLVPTGTYLSLRFNLGMLPCCSIRFAAAILPGR
jgi:hypothetical protein